MAIRLVRVVVVRRVVVAVWPTLGGLVVEHVMSVTAIVDTHSGLASEARTIIASPIIVIAAPISTATTADISTISITATEVVTVVEVAVMSTISTSAHPTASATMPIVTSTMRPCGRPVVPFTTVTSHDDGNPMLMDVTNVGAAHRPPSQAEPATRHGGPARSVVGRRSGVVEGSVGVRQRIRGSATSGRREAHDQPTRARHRGDRKEAGNEGSHVQSAR